MDTSKAKQLDQIEKNLVNIFKTQQKLEEIEEKSIEKSFKPVINAIGKVEEKLDNVSKQSMELLPVLNKFDDTSYNLENNDEESYNLNYYFDENPTTSTPNKQIDFEQSKRIDPKELDKNIIEKIYGPIASTHLVNLDDKIFGIYYDKGEKCLKIGDSKIEVYFDDIIVKDKQYKGTKGLWSLLTEKNIPNSDIYTREDLYSYSSILLSTNAIFQNNDPNSKKPKSSRSNKWIDLISNIWDKKLKSKKGSGVRKYIDNSKVEYRFIDDFNKLYSLMNYIYAQEKAGHNNFLNEKRAISDFICNKLNEIIEKPEGIKYLIRLWPSIQNNFKEGFGIINDLINNLPFELHVPNYNFLGPGTKLDMRLKRGDKGINKLDEAAKEHDIFYKNHQDVESRNIADKILEEKAIDRIFSSDADLGERLVSIPTAGVMYIKRKLGMGLDPELKF